MTNLNLIVPIKETLPGLTTVYQSKVMTNKTFKGFDVLHNRLYLYVLFHFRNEIYKNITQLELDFNDNNNNNILQIKIELNQIAYSRKDYQKVINAAKDLSYILISQNKIIENEEHEYEARLFDKVYIPKEKYKKKHILVDIEKNLYNDLIKKHIENGKLVYTKFYYEVCAQSRNRYLPKLYMLLSDSESRGFMPPISHFKLASVLGIDLEINKSYMQIKNFNSRILEPIKKELYNKCKFMFNYSFHKYVGKDEYYYKFIIINRDELLKIENQFNHIKSFLLPVYYDNLIELIEFKLKENYSSIYINKIAQHLFNATYDLKNKPIDNPLEYLKNCLLDCHYNK